MASSLYREPKNRSQKFDTNEKIVISWSIKYSLRIGQVVGIWVWGHACSLHTCIHTWIMCETYNKPASLRHLPLLLQFQAIAAFLQMPTQHLFLEPQELWEGKAQNFWWWVVHEQWHVVVEEEEEVAGGRKAGEAEGRGGKKQREAGGGWGRQGKKEIA